MTLLPCLRPLFSAPSSARFASLLAALLLVLVSGSKIAFAAELPAPVAAALGAARIPADAVSVWVQPVDAPAPMLQLNAERPMNPASVMKLVTAFAAMDRLGPAYQWTTRIATTGTVRHGVLHGNLYIIGGGDPFLTYERLWKLLRQLRGLTGIDTVDGDIVLDDSALLLPPHDPDAFDGRGLRPYNAGPYGLLMQFNSLRLSLLPAPRAGGEVRVATDPPLVGLNVINRLKTSDGPCPVWYSGLDARLEPGPRLVLEGSLPASCGRRDWSAAPLPPADYALALTAALWKELGGRVEGQVRAGPAPVQAGEVLREDSPPLADVVRDMNKWSSNVIARQLLATLGSTAPSRAPDMVRAGAYVAFDQLNAAGIPTAGLVLENGSGLSRQERVSAATLGQLLAVAWRRPWMPEYIAALPVAGVDGTARRRLADSPANGQAHIKTGTINGVRAMGGYVLDRNGHRHIVVMLVNHPEAAASQAAQDALLEWVWAQQG